MVQFLISNYCNLHFDVVKKVFSNFQIFNFSRCQQTNAKLSCTLKNRYEYKYRAPINIKQKL